MNASDRGTQSQIAMDGTFCVKGDDGSLTIQKRSFRNCLVLVFLVPVILLAMGMRNSSVDMLFSAFVTQYIGLLAERWFFFAQANHPQNLYYQTV